MNRLEFQQNIKILSERELQFKNGKTDEPFFQALAQLGYVDENGYYILPEDIHNCIAPPPDSSPLSEKLMSSPLQNKLRLLINDRFAKSICFQKSEFVNVFYSYSGNLRILFPNKTIIVPEGHICLIGMNVPYSYELATEEDISLCFHINQSYFSKNILYGLSNTGPIMEFLVETYFNKPHHYNYQVFDCSQDDKMKIFFENIFLEYLNPGVCSEALLESYIKILFIELARCEKISDEEEATESPVFEILKYMELNSQNCSLQELSEHFNFSSKHISKMIKQSTGISYSEYLTRIKLADVCNYLKDTQLSIQEIAERCGYTNRNFFYKKFYEYYNMSPKEYRMEHQKDL